MVGGPSGQVKSRPREQGHKQSISNVPRMEPRAVVIAALSLQDGVPSSFSSLELTARNGPFRDRVKPLALAGTKEATSTRRSRRTVADAAGIPLKGSIDLDSKSADMFGYFAGVV